MVLLAGGAAAAGARGVRVELEGLPRDLRRNVTATLSIARRQERRRATDAYLRHLHSRAEDEIRRALEPFGYYRPIVRTELVTGRTWVARYRVDPGPPLRLDTVRVEVQGEGRTDPEFTKRVAGFPLREGDVLRHAAYETGKAAFETAAAHGGYVDGQFLLHRVRVDLERNAGAIELIFDTGRRHTFGDVFFDQDVLEPGMMRSFVTFRMGDAMDFRKMLQLQTDLSGTGYFSRVEVTPEHGAAENAQVPILVVLTPSRPSRLSGGVGYGTDDGARLRTLTEFRRLNGWGHRAEIETRLAQIDKGAGARYMIPTPNPRTDLASVSASWRDQRTTVSSSEIAMAGVSLLRRLGPWQATAEVNYQRETFRIGPDQGTRVFLVPGGTWERVRADNRFDVRNGDRLRLHLRGGHTGLFSDATFLQGRADARYILGIGAARLIGRFDAGFTSASAFRALPPSLRFFAGGATSVRGYPFQSLGPRDSLGRVIGGRHLLIGSIEADHRFLPRWGAAVFYDVGNAMDRWRDRVYHGAGAGVRWWSPVGLVRVDVGWGLNRGQSGRGVELHLVMGPEL